ncbi:MAG: NAD-dependent epimerase/dehydratase family protein [Sedimentisphaerales bacterium]|nr:NAD-dependent epimerase/dehydratase family protein [Sedimentisphaerales bacterium]
MNVVTGATGLLGSHIVEKLVEAGQPVRVLVRSTSDTSFLDTLGVEKVTGDLTDPASCAALCRDAQVVYHAAARVGDWGPWEEFRLHTIEATTNLAQAAQQAGVRRFLHVSSISAYGHPNGSNLVLDETAPLGVNVHRWSYYTLAKVAAERRLWRMWEQDQFPLTVIRPSWIYGIRDRTTIERFHRIMTSGKIKIIGSGDNRLNVVNASNAADACLLAAGNPVALGQAYNCSNDGAITQKEYLALWAEAFGCEPPTKKVPFWLASSVAFDCEVIWRLLRIKSPPFVTRYTIWLMGRLVYFPADKAREQLGWQPRISYAAGIAQTARWFLQQRQAAVCE